ncbi:hypothetical protein V6Z12_A04G169700 [Gossypium hirsutum]
MIMHRLHTKAEKEPGTCKLFSFQFLSLLVDQLQHVRRQNQQQPIQNKIASKVKGHTLRDKIMTLSMIHHLKDNSTVAIKYRLNHCGMAKDLCLSLHLTRGLIPGQPLPLLKEKVCY